MKQIVIGVLSAWLGMAAGAGAAELAGSDVPDHHAFTVSSRLDKLERRYRDVERLVEGGAVGEAKGVRGTQSFRG